MSKKNKRRARAEAMAVVTAAIYKAVGASRSQPARQQARPLLPAPGDSAPGYVLARISAELATAVREPTSSEHYDPVRREYAAALDRALVHDQNEQVHLSRLLAPIGVPARGLRRDW